MAFPHRPGGAGAGGPVVSDLPGAFDTANDTVHADVPWDTFHDWNPELPRAAPSDRFSRLYVTADRANGLDPIPAPLNADAAGPRCNYEVPPATASR